MITAILSRLRRPPSTTHPTPIQAAHSLAEGACLYAPVSTCSGRAVPVGLEGDEDMTVVLVCRAHYGRLRQLDGRALRQLREHLRAKFIERLLIREPAS